MKVDRMQKGRAGQRGSAMFAALSVVVTISVLGACLLQLSASISRQQVGSVDNKRAFYLAEAGLSEAVYGLKMLKSGNVGTEDLPARFGDGLFWVEAEDQGEGRTKLTSTGLAGTGRFALGVVVERIGTGVGSLGIFGGQALRIGAGSLIDTYDSTLGSYQALPEVEESLFSMESLSDQGEGLQMLSEPPEPPPSVASLVGCNGDITVQGSRSRPTRIEGDVTPGPESAVTASGGVTITGSTAPAPETLELPPIEVPDDFSARGDLMLSPGDSQTLPTGSGRYGRVVVPQGATLEIEGPCEVVLGELYVAPGGAIHIDSTSGGVTVYVKTHVKLSPGSTLTSVEAAPALTSILIAASEWLDRDGDGVPDPPAEIGSTGTLFGMLYAPESPISIATGLELFGAVTAQELTLGEDARVHFDQALFSEDGGQPGDAVLLSWRVVDLPQAEIVELRTDALEALLSKGIELPNAADAHEGVMCKILFLDWSSQQQYWRGAESQFDWARAQTILAIWREGDLSVPALIQTADDNCGGG